MEQKAKATNSIVEGVIWKSLLAFFFPILLGTFFQQMYNTVDSVVVGNFVGKEALAAVGGSAAQILNLLTDLKKELGLAMVFISHDIQTVRYISDDIIVMNGGKIVEQGEAKQVFQHPQDPYTKMLLGAAPSLLHPKLGE